MNTSGIKIWCCIGLTLWQRYCWGRKIGLSSSRCMASWHSRKGDSIASQEVPLWTLTPHPTHDWRGTSSCHQVTGSPFSSTSGKLLIFSYLHIWIILHFFYLSFHDRSNTTTYATTAYGSNFRPDCYQSYEISDTETYLSSLDSKIMAKAHIKQNFICSHTGFQVSRTTDISTYLFDCFLAPECWILI